jgi:hypothetical protein
MEQAWNRTGSPWSHATAKGPLMRRHLIVLASVTALVTTATSTSYAAGRPPTPIFAAPVPIDTTPMDPVSIGDVDGDGNPDLVADFASRGAVAVYLGTGDGSFAAPRLYAAETPTGPVAIGDVTGDGIADLAVTSISEDGVRVLPGPLAEPRQAGIPEQVAGAGFYPTGDSPASLAVGDLDQSGVADLVVGNTGDDTISVLLADHHGGFQTRQDYHAPNALASALAVADLDDDGILDIVAVSYRTNDASVLLGNANGTFQNAQTFGSDYLAQPTAVAVGDLDGNTLPDLVIGRQGRGIVVLLGAGGGSFVPQAEASLPDAIRQADVAAVAIADLNLDGDAEIVLGTVNSAGNIDPGRIAVLVGDNGTFASLADYSVISGEGVSSIAIGDLDLDTRPDIAVAQGPVRVLFNQIGPITPIGSHVVVRPFDPSSGDSPVTITFTDVSQPGDTTLDVLTSGPPAPTNFQVAGSYYHLSTTAVFDHAEVCVDLIPPVLPITAPTLVHWVGTPPVISPTTTYFRNALGAIAPSTSTTPASKACANVTSFSPFALVVPTTIGDSAAPTIVCGAADTAWHAGNVSINCSAYDDGSGLADPADAAFMLTTSVADGVENADASTGMRTVCDVAGHCTTAGPIGANMIDRRAPTLVLPTDLTVNATAPGGAIATYGASASDGVDPHPAVSCNPASGSAFPIEVTPVTCTATDHVGNRAIGSFTVTVLGATTQLSRLVNDMISASSLPPTVKSQLLAYLRSLVNGFDPGIPAQRTMACIALRLYSSAVGLLSGRGVQPAQATEWIAASTRIRAVIGCQA